MAISYNWTDGQRKRTVGMLFVTNLQRKSDFSMHNNFYENMNELAWRFLLLESKSLS